jgi:hypothetical protein
LFTSKITEKSDEHRAHTTESIIAKLDSDLSDSERKSFLKILVNSPQTLELLSDVTVAWEQRLVSIYNEIKTLKRDSAPKYLSIDNVSSTNQYTETDVSTLTKQQLAYEHSARNAELSLCFLDEILTETEQLLMEENNALSIS